MLRYPASQLGLATAPCSLWVLVAEGLGFLELPKGGCRVEWRASGEHPASFGGQRGKEGFAFQYRDVAASEGTGLRSKWAGSGRSFRKRRKLIV